MGSPDTFIVKVPTAVVEGEDFQEWLVEAEVDQFDKVQSMIDRIEYEGVITSVKDLGLGLYEKKWATGLRVYFAVVHDNQWTLLILGSGKGHHQSKAIMRSRKLMMGYQIGKAKKV